MLFALLGEITKERFKTYIFEFTRNIEKTFKEAVKPPLLFLHLLAILVTIPLVILGIDWQYFVFFRQLAFLEPFLFPAVIIGGLTPILLPAAIYLYGKYKEYPQLEPLAFALTHTAVVGLFWSALYKSFTGRMGPEFEEYTVGTENYTDEFFFGFLIGGVFDGWPSGHTTIAFAFAVTMLRYRPNKPIMEEIRAENDLLSRLISSKRLWVFYAIYVGFGVSTNIHWLSDFIAGAFIGIAVGISTARVFEEEYERGSTNSWDRRVKVTFLIIFLTIIFSIIIPRDILGL